MKRTTIVRNIALTAVALALVSGCDQPKKKSMNSAAPKTSAAKTTKTKKAYDKVDRATFNRVAVELNLPVYWRTDTATKGAVTPDEVVSLLFYPTSGQWVKAGAFTPAFDEAYKKIVAWSKAPQLPAKIDAKEKARRELVLQDLDQGRSTLVYSDLSGIPAEEKTFVKHVLAAIGHVDKLYAMQKGLPPLEKQIPADDEASKSMFRRNWGPKCRAPKTESNPACSAVPSAPKRFPVGMYPAKLQEDEHFCDKLAKNKDAKKLMDPFVVVQEKDGKLQAVSLHDAFGPEMDAVSKELKAAAAAITSPKEAALKKYLEAAAQAFTDNKWQPADEAWSKMNATNSKWYLRIGPDEVYWDPCSRKAGFHVSFARINQDSLRWQKKLVPVQQNMEDTLAKHIGAPYKARKVTFHLPDFIDIVANAGNSRNAMGATVGQSLPNWGPVANEGRGRTVTMSNLYTDPDSLRIRKAQSASLLVKATMDKRAKDQDPGMLSIILHEATHNLGPAHEYQVKGKADTAVFGGPLASTMEELKAQTGALWYLDFLKKKDIIKQLFAEQSYVDSLIWAFNHIARGMYTSTHKPKTYSQLAAIQVGFLMDEGAITFNKDAMAANGKDKGAFEIHFDKFPAAVDKLMKLVGQIKAKGDKAGAEKLIKKYVDGDVVPMKVIAERSLRYPKASFVYAIKM